MGDGRIVIVLKFFGGYKLGEDYTSRARSLRCVVIVLWLYGRFIGSCIMRRLDDRQRYVCVYSINIP